MPSSIDPAKTRCSLLFFLATPAEEDALREVAGSRGILFEKVGDRDLGAYHWLGPVGNETVIAIRPSREGGIVAMGAHGRLGTASRGIQFREATGAQGIVQLGMAFGIDPRQQRPGDVLVSTDLVPYDNRDIRPRDGGHPGWVADYGNTKRESARPSLIDLFQREARRRRFPFSIRFGAMLSGAARIHCASFRDELVRDLSNGEVPIIGGEMEGVGLLAASRSARDPIWCVVKGISDFADEGRGAMIKESRPVACRNAAEFVLSALQDDAHPSEHSEVEEVR